jgi:hypothetical protein
MRFFGAVFMALGLLVGIALSAFLLTGGTAFGLTWILSLVVTKLTFLGAMGLIGVGAVLRRIDRRRECRTLASGAERQSQST